MRIREIVSASTRNAAIRSSLVWELSTETSPGDSRTTELQVSFMNRRRSTLYLLAALLLAGCGAESVLGPERTANIARSWPAAGIDVIKVTEVSGSIRIEAAQT